MTTFFITRHPGAREWAREEGIAIDRLVDHLDPEDVQPGDTVLGTLPVNLAAKICAKGAKYFHLSLDLPAEWRGRELTAEDMRRFGAALAEYRVEPVARSHAPRGNAAPDARRPAASSPSLDESHAP
jgi:CRISPR-associated protein Csx16